MFVEYYWDIVGQDEGFFGGELSGEYGLKFVLVVWGQVVDFVVGLLVVLFQVVCDQFVLFQLVEQLIGCCFVELDDVVQGMFDKVVDFIIVLVLFGQ